MQPTKPPEKPIYFGEAVLLERLRAHGLLAPTPSVTDTGVLVQDKADEGRLNAWALIHRSKNPFQLAIPAPPAKRPAIIFSNSLILKGAFGVPWVERAGKDTLFGDFFEIDLLEALLQYFPECYVWGGEDKPLVEQSQWRTVADVERYKPQAATEAEVRRSLAAQGLNQNDFVVFDFSVWTRVLFGAPVTKAKPREDDSKLLPSRRRIDIDTWPWREDPRILEDLRLFATAEPVTWIATKTMDPDALRSLFQHFSALEEIHILEFDKHNSSHAAQLQILKALFKDQYWLYLDKDQFGSTTDLTIANSKVLTRFSIPYSAPMLPKPTPSIDNLPCLLQCITDTTDTPLIQAPTLRRLEIRDNSTAKIDIKACPAQSICIHLSADADIILSRHVKYLRLYGRFTCHLYFPQGSVLKYLWGLTRKPMLGIPESVRHLEMGGLQQLGDFDFTMGFSPHLSSLTFYDDKGENDNQRPLILPHTLMHAFLTTNRMLAMQTGCLQSLFLFGQPIDINKLPKSLIKLSFYDPPGEPQDRPHVESLDFSDFTLLEEIDLQKISCDRLILPKKIRTVELSDSWVGSIVVASEAPLHELFLSDTPVIHHLPSIFFLYLRGSSRIQGDTNTTKALEIVCCFYFLFFNESFINDFLCNAPRLKRLHCDSPKFQREAFNLSMLHTLHTLRLRFTEGIEFLFPAQLRTLKVQCTDDSGRAKSESAPIDLSELAQLQCLELTAVDLSAVVLPKAPAALRWKNFRNCRSETVSPPSSRRPPPLPTLAPPPPAELPPPTPIRYVAQLKNTPSFSFVAPSGAAVTNHLAQGAIRTQILKADGQCCEIRAMRIHGYDQIDENLQCTLSSDSWITISQTIEYYNEAEFNAFKERSPQQGVEIIYLSIESPTHQFYFLPSSGFLHRDALQKMVCKAGAAILEIRYHPKTFQFQILVSGNTTLELVAWVNTNGSCQNLQEIPASLSMVDDCALPASLREFLEGKFSQSDSLHFLVEAGSAAEKLQRLFRYWKENPFHSDFVRSKDVSRYEQLWEVIEQRKGVCLQSAVAFFAVAQFLKIANVILCDNEIHCQAQIVPLGRLELGGGAMIDQTPNIPLPLPLPLAVATPVFTAPAIVSEATAAVLETESPVTLAVSGSENPPVEPSPTVEPVENSAQKRIDSVALFKGLAKEQQIMVLPHDLDPKRTLILLSPSQKPLSVQLSLHKAVSPRPFLYLHHLRELELLEPEIREQGLVYKPSRLAKLIESGGVLVLNLSACSVAEMTRLNTIGDDKPILCETRLPPTLQIVLLVGSHQKICFSLLSRCVVKKWAVQGESNPSLEPLAVETEATSDMELLVPNAEGSPSLFSEARFAPFLASLQAHFKHKVDADGNYQHSLLRLFVAICERYGDAIERVKINEERDYLEVLLYGPGFRKAFNITSLNQKKITFTSIPPLEINLFSNPIGWQEKLFGLSVTQQGYELTGGVFLRAILEERSLIIYNRPESEELDAWIDAIQEEHEVYFNRQTYPVSPKTTVILKTKPLIVNLPNVSVVPWVENTTAPLVGIHTIKDCLVTKTIDSHGKQVSVPAVFGRKAVFCVVGMIPKNFWAELLTDIQERYPKTQSQFILAPQACIEDVPLSPAVPVHTNAFSAVGVTVSSDVDFYCKQWRDQHPTGLQIDLLPTMSAAHLIQSTAIDYDDSNQPHLRHHNGILLEALLRQQPVILNGLPSPILYYQCLALLREYKGLFQWVMPPQALSTLPLIHSVEVNYKWPRYRAYFTSSENLNQWDALERFYQTVREMTFNAMGAPQTVAYSYPRLKNMVSRLVLRSPRLHAHNPIKGSFLFDYPKQSEAYAQLNVYAKVCFLSESDTDNVNKKKLQALLKIHSFDLNQVLRSNPWALLNCFNGPVLRKLLPDLQGAPNLLFLQENISAIMSALKDEHASKPRASRLQKFNAQFRTLLTDPKVRLINLKGESGVGKTYSIRHCAAHYDFILFDGFSRVVDWLRPSNDEKIRVLLLDEANRELPGVLDFIKAVCENRTFYFQGECYEITPLLKVIATINPESYAGRYYHYLLAHYAETLYFPEPTLEEIEATFFENDIQARGLVAVERCLRQTNPSRRLTYRDWSDLAAHFYSTAGRDPMKAAEQTFAGEFENIDKRRCFIQLLALHFGVALSPVLPASLVYVRPGWCLPSEKAYLIEDIKNFLAMRKQKKRNRRGFLLEGPVGGGKSCLFKEVLNAEGESFIEVNSGAAQIKWILYEAALVGRMVVLNESNIDETQLPSAGSNPHELAALPPELIENPLENLVDSLLDGHIPGHGAVHEDFRLLLTQNPQLDHRDRRALSRSRQDRCVCRTLGAFDERERRRIAAAAGILDSQGFANASLAPDCGGGDMRLFRRAIVQALQEQNQDQDQDQRSLGLSE